MPKAEPSRELLRKMYPQLSEEELEQVEWAFDQYIDLCLDALRNIERDPKAYARFKELTAERKKREKSGEDSNKGPE